MTRFLRTETFRFGKKVAILEDYVVLKIDRRDLRIRIRNLKRSGADTTEEEKALTALNEANENGNIRRL